MQPRAFEDETMRSKLRCAARAIVAGELADAARAVNNETPIDCMWQQSVGAPGDRLANVPNLSRGQVSLLTPMPKMNGTKPVGTTRPLSGRLKVYRTHLPSPDLLSIIRILETRVKDWRRKTTCEKKTGGVTR